MLFPPTPSYLMTILTFRWTERGVKAKLAAIRLARPSRSSSSATSLSAFGVVRAGAAEGWGGSIDIGAFCSCADETTCDGRRREAAMP